MTNQEWLSTIPADHFVDAIHWIYHIYGKRYANTRSAVIDWLSESHDNCSDVQQFVDDCHKVFSYEDYVR